MVLVVTIIRRRVACVGFLQAVTFDIVAARRASTAMGLVEGALKWTTGVGMEEGVFLLVVAIAVWWLMVRRLLLVLWEGEC